MTPILGILASSFFQPTGDYQAIMTATVDSGGASSITFSSIPSTYKHLQIRMLSIGNGSASSSGFMSFNSDTTHTNYYTHYLIGNGSAASAGANNDNFTPFTVGASTSPAVSIIDILDYVNGSKNKVVRELNGYDANGSGRINFDSVLWSSTSAISSITFSFTSFSQYTQFALYGIKGE